MQEMGCSMQAFVSQACCEQKFQVDFTSLIVLYHHVGMPSDEAPMARRAVLQDEHVLFSLQGCNSARQGSASDCGWAPVRHQAPVWRCRVGQQGRARWPCQQWWRRKWESGLHICSHQSNHQHGERCHLTERPHCLLICNGARIWQPTASVL